MQLAFRLSGPRRKIFGWRQRLPQGTFHRQRVFHPAQNFPDPYGLPHS
jgi:hypothetical protein